MNDVYKLFVWYRAVLAGGVSKAAVIDTVLSGHCIDGTDGSQAHPTVRPV